MVRPIQKLPLPERLSDEAGNPGAGGGTVAWRRGVLGRGVGGCWRARAPCPSLSRKVCKDDLLGAGPGGPRVRGVAGPGQLLQPLEYNFS